MAPRIQILLTIVAFNLAASVAGAAVGVMATFREDDIRAGKQFTDEVRLRELISRLPLSDQQPLK